VGRTASCFSLIFLLFLYGCEETYYSVPESAVDLSTKVCEQNGGVKEFWTAGRATNRVKIRCKNTAEFKLWEIVK
jgi:hypothetical protein